jgi:hypothetical protein
VRANKNRRDSKVTGGGFEKLGWFVRGLVNASPDLAALAAQTDLTAFQKIGDRRDGFAVIFAVAAYRQDEIAEAIIMCGFFKRLFHGAEEMDGGRMEQMECHRAERC